MKFKYLLLSFAVAGATFCQSCDDDVEDFDAPAAISLSSVALDGSLNLKVGESKTLAPTFTPTNASSKSVKWTSSAADVAEVNGNGDVKAKSIGTATITVTTVNGGKTASCTVTVTAAALVYDLNGGKGTTPAQVTINGETEINVLPEGTDLKKDTCDFLGWSNKKNGEPLKKYKTAQQDTLWAIWQRNEWVDFGLPSGNLWALTNIGADVPEKTGDLFAWGELGQKANFTWNGYNFAADYLLKKYQNGNADIAANKETVDNLTVLELDDDAAYNATFLGKKWKMPTEADFQELIDNCDWEWTETFNGPRTPGFIVKKKGDDKVTMFLPIANYWTSSIDSADPFKAMSFVVDQDAKTIKEALRYTGLSIRPIKIK